GRIMKTKLLYLIASFAFATNCSAQWATTIDVNLKNGEQIKTIISDGGSMEFYDCDEDLEYVDLGLSVKWAKMNVGASTITEMGDYFYWGDTIKIAEGNNHDSYENYYGRLKDHIAKTKFDVAYKYSGKNWRMPTAEEFKELIEKCDWQVVTYNDTKGYLVVGPNKNYIFLPFDGYYYKDKFYSFYDELMYWTDSNKLAMSNRVITNCDYALPVRPVYDESGDKWLSLEEYLAYNDDIQQAIAYGASEPFIFPSTHACQEFVNDNKLYFLDDEGEDVMAKEIVCRYFARHLNDELINFYKSNYGTRYECSDGKTVYVVDEIMDDYLHYLLSQQGCIDLSQPDMTTKNGAPFYTKYCQVPLSFVKLDSNEYNVDGYYAVRPVSASTNPYIAYEVPFPMMAQSKYTIRITMAPDVESEEPLPNLFRIYTYSKSSNSATYPNGGTTVSNSEGGTNFVTSANEFNTISFDYETSYATNLLIQLESRIPSKQTLTYSRTIRIAEISINCENEYITNINTTPSAFDSQPSIFDLTGRKINEIESNGVYIINGDKVLVK
ncbi:MAG: hypothetical protein KBT06_10325, partial [Prevotellaceae bacterium]|nr:hypothetical protein [Candidatus Colivivens equi]